VDGAILKLAVCTEKHYYNMNGYQKENGYGDTPDITSYSSVFRNKQNLLSARFLSFSTALLFILIPVFLLSFFFS